MQPVLELLFCCSQRSTAASDTTDQSLYLPVTVKQQQTRRRCHFDCKTNDNYSNCAPWSVADLTAPHGDYPPEVKKKEKKRIL